MEVLQLILNVIIITALTSSALMWNLQKRDSRKFGVDLLLEPDQHGEKAATQTASTLDHSEEVLKGPFCEPEAARLVPPPIDQDIRQCVAQRAREWAALSLAAKEGRGQAERGIRFYRNRDKHAGLRR